MRRTRVLLLALAAPAIVALLGGAAVAQTHRTPAARGHAGTARPATPKKSATPDGGAEASTTAGALPVGTAIAPGGTTLSSDAGSGVVEAKTLDGGTQVFKFSELDIEGRLKSPQLVYFLRRVRAEFAAGDLGHRTFMREMSETRKESSF
jgi:hypothetical protein